MIPRKEGDLWIVDEEHSFWIPSMHEQAQYLIEPKIYVQRKEGGKSYIQESHRIYYQSSSPHLVNPHPFYGWNSAATKCLPAVGAANPEANAPVGLANPVACGSPVP
jgi:hypothetical protein